jgi:hypothetical protein
MLGKKEVFDPEKITILDVKMVKEQVDVPEEFEESIIAGHHADSGLRLGVNLGDKLIKMDLTIEIKTESKSQNHGEATGSFHLVFLYQVENLDDLIETSQSSMIELHPALGSALSAISYSTARGVLLTRLRGTALQNFMLPVINPNSLIQKSN